MPFYPFAYACVNLACDYFFQRMSLLVSRLFYEQVWYVLHRKAYINHIFKNAYT